MMGQSASGYGTLRLMDYAANNPNSNAHGEILAKLGKAYADMSSKELLSPNQQEMFKIYYEELNRTIASKTMQNSTLQPMQKTDAILSEYNQFNHSVSTDLVLDDYSSSNGLENSSGGKTK